MDRTLDGVVMRATIVLLGGGLSLVAAGTGGIGGSLALVFALGMVAAGVGLFASFLDENGTDGEFSVGHVVADLWVGPVLAAVVVVGFLGASPGEVQALGGLVGLLGMVNYFLRPFYHLVYGIGQRVANV